jgi:hypothetical protein
VLCITFWQITFMFILFFSIIKGMKNIIV